MFYEQAKISGEAIDRLDERTKRIIESFLSPQNPTLSDLMAEAGVGSRERVRQLITSGVKKAHQALPPQLREQYDLEELTHPGNTYTPKTRARISEAHRGRKHTPETRARISEANKGRKHTPEARARMSEAQRTRRLREKEQREAGKI